MGADIVTRLRDEHVWEFTMQEREQAADEIVRLRAEVERKADYAERMDALAEERLIGWNAERALADQLALELRMNHPLPPYLSRPAPACPSCVALAAYEAARKEAK